MRTKLILSLCFCLVATLCVAQKQRKRPSKPSGGNDFLKTQWWLGIRSGLNFTNANLIESYPGFYPINYAAESLEKEYEDFSSPGFQVGLDITFYHAGLSIALQPTFLKHNVSYMSEANWIGNTEDQQFSSTYNVKQGVTYIDLPLSVKYDILQNKVRPFVMAGAYYGFIFDANKTVRVTETDYGFTTPISYERTIINLNNKEEFNNTWGVLGGIGASFDYWNIRTIIDIQYRHSFSSVINEAERFKESAFSSFGELSDDYSLQNFSTSISFVFPLRYIDSQFKAL